MHIKIILFSIFSFLTFSLGAQKNMEQIFRKYKNDERIRYILSRPFECRSIMKKFYQCVDFKEFKNNLSFTQ